MNPATWSSGRRWLILTIAAGATVAFSAAVGIVPTYRLAGSSGAVAMGLAGAVVWLVSAVGAIPVARARAASARQAIAAVQLGMLIRFGLMLVGALTAVFGTSLPQVPLLVWGVVHYLAVLVVVTGTELWLLRNPRREASA
ncbi:MAG: hypothetical protein JXA69_19190 [Phycisphaerae bacterium]|nr:hypothetical protein [Phycisphaerae bacterium]